MKLDRPRHHEYRRLQAQQASVGNVIDRGTQAPMVVVLKRNKTEGLKNTVGSSARCTEDFGHTVHRSRLGLKCEFNKTTVVQRMLHLQQPTGNGNGLQFSFCAPAIFQADCSQN